MLVGSEEDFGESHLIVGLAEVEGEEEGLAQVALVQTLREGAQDVTVPLEDLRVRGTAMRWRCSHVMRCDAMRCDVM